MLDGPKYGNLFLERKFHEFFQVDRNVTFWGHHVFCSQKFLFVLDGSKICFSCLTVQVFCRAWQLIFVVLCGSIFYRAWRSKNIYCKRWQYLVFKRQFYFQSVIFPLPVSVLILNRLRQFLLWAKNSIRFRVERIKKRIRLNRFRVKDVWPKGHECISYRIPVQGENMDDRYLWILGPKTTVLGGIL